MKLIVEREHWRTLFLNDRFRVRWRVELSDSDSEAIRRYGLRTGDVRELLRGGTSTHISLGDATRHERQLREDCEELRKSIKDHIKHDAAVNEYGGRTETEF